MTMTTTTTTQNQDLETTTRRQKRLIGNHRVKKEKSFCVTYFFECLGGVGQGQGQKPSKVEQYLLLTLSTLKLTGHSVRQTGTL